MTDAQRLQRSIALRVHTPKRVCGLAWISLQADGSISIGLSDRAFAVERLETIDDDGRPQVIDYTARYSPSALRNPHFTFHPRNMLSHLTVSRERELVSWILPVDLYVGDDGIAQWFRVRSAPIHRIPTHGETRPVDAEILMRLDREDRAVQLQCDFIATIPPTFDARHELYLEWHGRVLRIACSSALAEGPALGMTIWH